MKSIGIRIAIAALIGSSIGVAASEVIYLTAARRALKLYGRKA